MFQYLTMSWIYEKLYVIYLLLALCLNANSAMRLISAVVLVLMCGIQALVAFKRRKIRMNRFSACYIGFVLLALASCLWCVSWARSEAILYELVTSLMFVFAMASGIRDRKTLDRYAMGFMFAVAVMCAVLIVGCGFQIRLIRSNGSAMIGLDRNYFSQIVAFASVIVVFYAHQEKKRHLLIYLPFYLLVIFGSGSRKAIISVAIGLVLMYAFAYRKEAEKFAKFMIVLTGIVAAVAGYAFYAKPEMIRRIFVGLATFLGSDTVNTDSSALIRVALIDRAMELFQAHPLLGVGLNNFSYFAGDINPYGGYMYAHNNFAELLADFGMVGFCLYYTAYLIYAKKIIQKRNAVGCNWLCALALALGVMNLLNDIASVSYYLKMYQFVPLLGYKLVMLGGSANEKNSGAKQNMLD